MNITLPTLGPLAASHGPHYTIECRVSGTRRPFQLTTNSSLLLVWFARFGWASALSLFEPHSSQSHHGAFVNLKIGRRALQNYQHRYHQCHDCIAVVMIIRLQLSGRSKRLCFLVRCVDRSRDRSISVPSVSVSAVPARNRTRMLQ